MDHSARRGAVVVAGDVADIVFIRRLAFPIEAVWRALTDPEERARWFGQTSRLIPQEGGAIEMIADGPPVPEAMRKMVGRVLVYDEPHVFEHAWHQAHLGDSVVRYELERDGDGTLLRMIHKGLRYKDAAGYVPGQHAYLDRLEAALSGAPVPDWQARYAEVATLYGPPPRWAS